MLHNIYIIYMYVYVHECINITSLIDLNYIMGIKKIIHRTKKKILIYFLKRRNSTRVK